MAVHQASAEPVSSPPAIERRTQAERRSEAERALLDAAMRLFARHGVEPTSLADIGEEAGYSRGLVNHHFGSRAALVERLARRGQRRFVRAVEDIDDEPGPEQVAAVADTYLGLFEHPTDDLRAFFVMRGTAIPSEATLRATYAEDDQRVRRNFERLITTGQRAGTIAAQVDAVAFATMLIGMLRGVGTQALVAPEAVDLAAVRRQVRSLVLTTLSPATGSSNDAEAS